MVCFEGYPLVAFDVVLALLAALLAHVAVNLLNEHHDFTSGLDETTIRTPFSGGSGSLQDCPQAAPLVRQVAVACLLVVVMIGGWFLWRSGPWLLAYGVIGILLVVSYTGWLTRYPLLCLIAPGLGFGVLIVTGTYHALTGEFAWIALWVAVPPSLMVSALLLLNQIPDIDADREAGRRHLAIELGPYRSARLATVMVWLAFVLVAVAAWGGALPSQTMMMWLASPLLLVWFFRLRQLRVDAGHQPLIALLGLNVVVLLGSLALLNIGLWLAV